MIDKQVPQKLVSDKDQRLTRSGDMIDAQNVTIVNRGEGSEMVIKTMKGHNSAVAASGTTPINAEVRVIGAVPDDQLGVIYVFVASDTGHDEDAIYKYTASTNTYEKVLKRTALNFNKNSFVKADILNKAFQQDGVLQTVMYFTDNVNPPRKINVDRAISGDYDALSDLYFKRAISAIKSAPTKPPTFSFDTDSAVKVNHFEQSAMQFATQIIYKDNEESALSPYSKLAVSPVAAMSSTQIADFGLSIFTSNVCEIKHNVSLQHPDMKAVRLLARDGNDGPFFIIDEFDVTQNVVREVYGNSTTVYDIADQKYRFYNDVIGSVIPDTTANKLYDNVPLKAEGQVIRDSRLFYSNYTEGRPNHDISVTDFSLEPNYSAVGGSVKDYVADDEGPDMVTQVGTINIDLDIEAADDIGVSEEFAAGTRVDVSFVFKPEFTATATDLIRLSVIQFSIDDQEETGAGILKATQVNFNDLHTEDKKVSISLVTPEAYSTPEDLAEFIQSELEQAEVELEYQYADIPLTVHSTASGTLQATTLEGGLGVSLMYVTFKFGEVTTTPDDHVTFKPRITNIRLDPTGIVESGAPVRFDDPADTFTVMQAQATENIFAKSGEQQSEVTYSNVSATYISDQKVSISQVSNTLTFKAGATHNFGIVYYDEHGRSGFVNELKSVYVKALPERADGETAITDKGPVSMTFTPVNGFDAPDWADSYQIVYGGSNVENVFQYTVGGAYARRLTTNDDNALHRDIDDSIHNIYVSLKTLSQYNRDRNTVREYSFTKGDKLRVISRRNDADDGWKFPTSSKGNLIEFDVVGVETIGNTGRPIRKEHADYTGDEEASPHAGQFLVLRAPAVDGTASNTTEANIEKYEGFDWNQITGTAYNGSVSVSLKNHWNKNCLVEIISPKKQAAEKIYYEIGERRPVGRYRDPQLGDHGTAFTILSGDVHYRSIDAKTPVQNPSNNWYLNTNENPENWEYKSRFIEDQSVSDLFPSKSWDRGRPHTVFKNAATVNRYNGITYSDPYIDDTGVLALSSFVPGLGNFYDLPSESGACKYIGNLEDMMFAIQERKVTKLLINKQVFSGAAGGGVIGLSTNVINAATPFPQDFGTRHPESVLSVDGKAFFYDEASAKAVLFTQGGMTAISDIDISSLFEDNSIKGSKNPDFRVCSGYDPADEVYFISLSPYAVTSYGGITLGFNTKYKAWQSKYTFYPDYYVTMGPGMYIFDWVDYSGSVQDKFIHTHNYDQNSNNFYNQDGRQASKVTVVSNKNPSYVKSFESVSLETDKKWSVTLHSSSDQETTNIFNVDNNWREREGSFYANVTGDNTSKSHGNYIQLGEVESVDGAVVTMKPRIKGQHIPKGYTLYRNNDSSVPVVDSSNAVLTDFDVSEKTLTFNTAPIELAAGDRLMLSSNLNINGDQIRGHWCEVRCSVTPSGTEQVELFAINTNFGLSPHHHG